MGRTHAITAGVRVNAAAARAQMLYKEAAANTNASPHARVAQPLRRSLSPIVDTVAADNSLGRMLVRAHNISVAFAAQPVLTNASFVISPGDKVGLVGPNGSGKTTLLRLILRELEPDRGEILFGLDLNTGYVRQDVPPVRGQTVSDTMRSEVVQLERQLAGVCAELAQHPDRGLLAKYEALEQEADTKFGRDYWPRVEKTLSRFGFGPERYQDAVATLSPGERARLDLARALVGRPEFLVLDEPTNYLDIGQREWLERFLAEFTGTVLVVSHDRVFLNRVVNRIFELRRTRLRIYEGDFDHYELQRQQERRELEEEYVQQQKEIRKLERVAAVRKVWSARREATKTSAGDSGFVSHRAAKMARRARHAEKRVEQMLERRRADKPFIEKRVRPVLPSRELPDKRAVYAKGLRKSFGPNRVVTEASLALRTGERVALVGPNGCGKTVLLRLLVGELEPDGGTSGFGAGLALGYFPQDLCTLDLNATALEEVMKSGASQETCRIVLGTLLLTKELATKRLGQLSAGERSKALLSRILAGGADVLVLDEPTNHLDIDTLEALEELLKRFPGAVLFASHDRAMIEKLATRVLEFKDGRLEERRNYRHTGPASR